MTATEYVVLVDEQDREVGQSEKLSAHQNNLLHRAFSVFIFSNTPEKKILLQQRALHKYHSAGLWTNACCSHPRPGETVIEGGERRLFEELGIKTSLSDRGWFYYNAHFTNGLSEHEIDHVLIGYVDETSRIQPHPEEIHAYRWITLEDLEAELKSHPAHFTAWFKEALQLAVQANMESF